MADKNLTDDQDVAVAEKTEEDAPESLQDKLKGVISVAVEEVGVLRRKLTVTVPRQFIDEEQDAQYKEMIADTVVPGFRRGRAPRRLVEKRFGREVGEQVQTKLVTNAYMAAIDKEDIKVLGDPRMWAEVKDKSSPPGEQREQLLDLHEALETMRLPEEGDLQFKCEVEVKPEIKVPDLEGIPIEKPKLEIGADDVTAEIDRVRARRGNYVPVLEGEVQADDLLICDLKLTVDGRDIKTADNIQLAARPQRVEGVTLSDFGDKVAGCKLGDVRTLEGELPDDYDREDLRGKQGTFEFVIRDIKRLELPPLDKTYLEAVGFDSEKEYRAWVKEGMEGRLERELRNGMRRQVAEYLVKNVELDLPEGLSTRQTDRVVERRMVEFRRRGVPQAEIDKHADELRTGAREQAVNDLKLHFIQEQVAEQLEIEVSEEEINAQIAAIARAYNRRFDRVRDELARDNGIESLYLQIRDEKCLEKLLETAVITEAKVETKIETKTKTAASKKSASKTKPAAAAKKTGTKKTTTKKVAKKTTTKKKTGSK